MTRPARAVPGDVTSSGTARAIAEARLRALRAEAEAELRSADERIDALIGARADANSVSLPSCSISAWNARAFGLSIASRIKPTCGGRLPARMAAMTFCSAD